MRSNPNHLFMFSALTTLVACSGGAPSAPLDLDESPYAEVVCAGFGLTAQSGTTLERIGFGTLPGSFTSPVAAVMLDADGEASGFGYVTADDSGTLALSVPLHPETPLAGGSVRMVFTDGTRACPVVDFSILPLPAATGEFELVLDMLQATLDAHANIAGTSREELNATPIEDVPVSVRPLAIVQSLLDDPANGASLRSVAEGGLSTEALDWLDRLTARTRLRSSLAAAPALATASAVKALPGLVSARPGNTALIPPTKFSSDDLTCDPDFVNTPELLDYCMKLAAELARSVTGLSREVSEDLRQLFSDLANNDLPVAREVNIVFGVVFWLIYSEREAAASVYPSRFVSIDLDATPNPFREDDEGPSSVTATVVAASLGYDMQQQILDGIGQARTLMDTYGGLDLSTGTGLDDIAAELGPQIENRLRNIQIEDLQIPAALFLPITLADSTWLDARVVSGDAIAVVAGARYEGRATGSALLSVRTKDGRFGDSQIADQIEISVPALQVTIAPDEVFLGAERTQVFRVRVAGSRHPELVEIDLPDSIQGEATITYNGDSTHTVQYTAPTTPDVGRADLLTVRHTAETGARGYSSVERLDIATIRFGGIRIITAADCLELGDTLQFEKVLPGTDDPEVVWSASAGSITSSGFFTAPTDPAVVTVTVAYANDATITDSVTFTVGGCSCRVSVRVDGQDLGATRQARFFLTQDLTAIRQIDWSGGVPGPEQSTATIGFGLPPDAFITIPLGTTGSFDGNGGGFVLGAPYRNLGTLDDPNLSPLSVTLSENVDGNTLEGSASGRVIMLDEPELRTGSFSMTFRIEADPRLSTPEARVCWVE